MGSARAVRYRPCRRANSTAAAHISSGSGDRRGWLFRHSASRACKSRSSSPIGANFRGISEVTMSGQPKSRTLTGRTRLIVNTEVVPANGLAERAAAMAMLEQIPGDHQVTVGADKGYDTQDFVAECRHLKVTPHVAQNTKRSGGSAIDARTTRHSGYAVSQKKRKRIEECFGWLKTIALIRKVRH